MGGTTIDIEVETQYFTDFHVVGLSQFSSIDNTPKLALKFGL
jgi:hypothetical protein